MSKFVIAGIAALLTVTGSQTAGAAQSTDPGALVEILTNEKIIRMADAKISEEIILLHIEKNRCEFSASTDDLIALHEAGLTEKVIRVIMDKASGSEIILTHKMNLLTQQMRSPEGERIDDAIRKLAGLKPSTKVASLLTSGNYLGSSSPQIRQGVCQALGRLGSRTAVPRLLDMLKDPEAMVRNKAAEAIARLKDQEMLDRLVKLRDEEPVERDGIYLALGYLGDRRATVHLIRWMQEAGDLSKNRAAAAFALGLLGDTSEKVISALRTVMLEDIFPEVRGNAVHAMARLTVALRGPQLHEMIAVMRKAYDRFPMNRKDILENLGNYADGQAILLLIEGLRPENPRAVREAAWRGLRQVTQERFKEDHDEWDAWWNIKGKFRFSIDTPVASSNGKKAPKVDADAELQKALDALD